MEYAESLWGYNRFNCKHLQVPAMEMRLLKMEDVRDLQFMGRMKNGWCTIDGQERIEEPKKPISLSGKVGFPFGPHANMRSGFAR